MNALIIIIIILLISSAIMLIYFEFKSKKNEKYQSVIDFLIDDKEKEDEYKRKNEEDEYKRKKEIRLLESKIKLNKYYRVKNGLHEITSLEEYIQFKKDYEQLFYDGYFTEMNTKLIAIDKYEKELEKKYFDRLIKEELELKEKLNYLKNENEK